MNIQTVAILKKLYEEYPKVISENLVTISYDVIHDSYIPSQIITNKAKYIYKPVFFKPGSLKEEALTMALNGYEDYDTYIEDFIQVVTPNYFKAVFEVLNKEEFPVGFPQYIGQTENFIQLSFVDGIPVSDFEVFTKPYLQTVTQVIDRYETYVIGTNPQTNFIVETETKKLYYVDIDSLVFIWRPKFRPLIPYILISSNGHNSYTIWAHELPNYLTTLLFEFRQLLHCLSDNAVEIRSV